ncbi:hypothetical protein CF327_g7591, partial [Tilletia walkeri]
MGMTPTTKRGTIRYGKEQQDNGRRQAAIYDATTGERLEIDKTGRVVTNGTAPQDTRDKRDGPASTSTRQDENGEGDGDGCGERRYLPQSAARRWAADFTAKTKPLGQEGGWTASVREEGQGSERQDQGPLPTETTSGWCFKAQGDDAETNQG